MPLRLNKIKNLNINKTCIGLGYEDLKKAGKKHVKVDDIELVLDQESPFVVQNIPKPMYRQFIHEPVDEDLLKLRLDCLLRMRKSKRKIRTNYLRKQLG